MEMLLKSTVILPAALLLATGIIPQRWANRFPIGLRRWVCSVAALQAMLAFGLAAAFAVGVLPPFHGPVIGSIESWPMQLGVFYDGVSALMLALVSFVGWVICNYSVRYLDGEATQGRYFRWTAFTLGAVAMMILSGNLLMFFAAWIMTSLGLHQLLLHYAERPAAQRAAWTKFTISRLGDVALIAALAMIYAEFGTFEFADLFAALASETLAVTPAMHIAGLLIVIGAVTKSAQVPFHTWLPQTMETPTPVSALMHAGIVNAGGYLIIRTSPLITLTPSSMTVLAIFGAVTACLGASVMLTQSSVKMTLAYSTVAQMGFMMLQCGLGAFSAAMLHILAHSLYKAHAFLSSGSVMAERAALQGPIAPAQPLSWLKLVGVGAAVIALVGVSLVAFGINPLDKPGGLLLGWILSLALTSWLVQVLRAGNPALLLRSFSVAGGLCFAYAASYAAVDTMISASVPQASQAASGIILAMIAVLGFGGLFWLQSMQSAYRPAWLNAWRVHAANGFYCDAFVRRVFGQLASR